MMESIQVSCMYGKLQKLPYDNIPAHASTVMLRRQRHRYAHKNKNNNGSSSNYCNNDDNK